MSPACPMCTVVWNPFHLILAMRDLQHYFQGCLNCPRMKIPRCTKSMLSRKAPTHCPCTQTRSIMYGSPLHALLAVWTAVSLANGQHEGAQLAPLHWEQFSAINIPSCPPFSPTSSKLFPPPSLLHFLLHPPWPSLVPSKLSQAL